MSDGNNHFWDGLDLKLRIDYAIIGLDLSLDKDQIETELRRSLYPEMKREDLQKTIILNAKSLIEKDADFALVCRAYLAQLYLRRSARLGHCKRWCQWIQRGTPYWI